MELIKLFDEQCYENLANAIIIQAAIDYRDACKDLETGDNLAMYNIKKIENFFKSDWADLLSCGLAPAILRRLQDEQKKKAPQASESTSPINADYRMSASAGKPKPVSGNR